MKLSILYYSSQFGGRKTRGGNKRIKESPAAGFQTLDQ
jgi:hypothetical protein